MSWLRNRRSLGGRPDVGSQGRLVWGVLATTLLLAPACDGAGGTGAPGSGKRKGATAGATGLPTTKKALVERIQGCVAELNQTLHASLVQAEEAQGRRAVRLRTNARAVVFAWLKVIEESGGDPAVRAYLASAPATLRRCFDQKGCGAFAPCVVEAQFGGRLIRKGESWIFAPPGGAPSPRPGAPGASSASGTPGTPAVPDAPDPGRAAGAAPATGADWEDAIPDLLVPAPTAESRAAAKPLVEALIKAHGGLPRLRALRTSHVEYDVMVHGADGYRGRNKLVMTYAAPDRLYQRLGAMSGALEICAIGRRGIRVRGPDAVTLSEEESERLQYYLQRGTEELLVLWTEGKLSIHRLLDAAPRALVGAKDGRPARRRRARRGGGKPSPRLAVTRGKRLVLVLTLDPRSHLVTSKIMRSRIDLVGMATVEYGYADYQRRDGDPVARVLRMRVNHRLHLVATLRKYERNPEVEAALFTCGGRLTPKAP